MSRRSYGSPTVPADTWRRQPPRRAIAHTDHGSKHTSWAFGRRLRYACLLGSMGSIGDCFDNSVAEAFGTLQVELLDEHARTDRDHLALAGFDWIEPATTPAAATPTARCSAPSTTRPHRGMINPTPTPSARPGEAQIEFFGGWASPGEPQSAGPRSLLLK